MKISFIIPVYNCKTFLPDCVASIRAAGIPDYEILLIDDGSTDGSGALCDELAAADPEIRVVHQPNAGASAARNQGIQFAQGEYIMFVDADDTLLPFDNLTFQHLNAGVDVLIFGMQFCYYRGNYLVKEEHLTLGTSISGSPKEIAENFKSLFCQNYFSPVWNKIIKRSVLIDHNLWFDPRLTNYEDLAFSLYLLGKCSSIVAIPQIHYLYKLNYDHDNTVDRIARIQDLMGNTDLIADTFLSFEAAAVDASAESIQQIRECLLSIYFELFHVKMKTTGICKIGQYCRDFKNDSYVDLCLQCCTLSHNQSRLYRWIQKENTCAIWLYVRYLKFRHFCARNIKRLIGRM